MKKINNIYDIAKVISEDINDNNGIKLFEDIHGIPIDGNAKIDQFMQYIDQAYSDFDIKDPKFQKIWDKFFPGVDIKTAPDVIKQDSNSSRAQELAALLSGNHKQNSGSDLVSLLRRLHNPYSRLTQSEHAQLTRNISTLGSGELMELFSQIGLDEENDQRIPLTADAIKFALDNNANFRKDVANDLGMGTFTSKDFDKYYKGDSDRFLSDF